MDVFVLVIILLMHGDAKDVTLPVLLYPSREVCKQKIAELEKDYVFKSPNLEIDCLPLVEFQKQEEEEKK